MKKFIKQYLNLNEDRFYLKCVISFWFLWLFSTSPLRSIVKDTAFASHWIFGIAPNFFAGITLVFWQAYGMSSKPFISFLCAFTVLMLSEFIQLFMSTQYADWNDILGSLIGASLSAIFISVRSKIQKRIANKDGKRI